MMATSNRVGAAIKQTESPHVKVARSLFLLLVSALLLAASSVLFPSQALANLTSGTASTENSESASDGPIGIYAAFPSETSWSQDLSHLFYYSDSLFAEPASTYNADLAYASAHLAAAADNSNTGGSDYSQKGKNVVRLMKDIGCSDIVANEGYTEKPGTKTNIGVAIGNKRIRVNGQDYRLFVIGARGGGYEQEWATNLKMGDGTSTGGDHQGFQEARDATIAFIMNYMNKHAREGERVKVWASGYCRGGIVLNMACAWLDKWIHERNGGEVSHTGSYNAEHNVYCEDYDSTEMRFTKAVAFDPASIIPSVTFSEKDVYCYPVNPPQGASKADVEANKNLTVGIHNLVNPDDWYPQVAPSWEGWEFSRYGTDHDLTGTYGADESFASRDKSLLETNKQGLDAAIERLKKINPNASYTSPQFRQYYFALTSIGFEPDAAGKGNVFVSKGKEMKYNQGKYFEEVFRFLFDAAGCTTRAKFTKEFQDDFIYLIGLTIGAPLDVREKLGSVVMKQALAAVKTETGYDISTTMGKMMIVSYINSWMADGEEGAAAMPKKILKTTFVNTLKELKIESDDAKVDHAAGSLAKIVKGLYKKEQAIGFFSFYHLGTVYMAGTSLNQAHWPEVSLAWLPDPQKKNVVRVTNNIEGAGTLSGEGVYESGATATLKAVPEENFTFSGWYDGEELLGAEPECTITVEKSRRIEARWNYTGDVEHRIRFNANGGSFAESQTAEADIKAGELVSLAMQVPSDPQYGSYDFKGWTSVSDDASTIVDLRTYRMPNHDTELYALWFKDDGSQVAETVHEISLRIEGGTYPETITRRTGDTFGPLPILKQYLPRGSYIVSWTVQNNDGSPIPGVETITEDTKVTNSFPTSFLLRVDGENIATLPSRTVKFYANLDGSQSPTGEPLFEVKVYQDEKVRISDAAPDETDIDTGIVRYTAPARANFLFSGWSTKPEADSAAYYPGTATLSYNSIPEGGLDLYAQWTEADFRSVAHAKVSGIADKTWTGKALAQQPTVELAGTTLKGGVDYTVSFKNNKNVGTATVTITGKGFYSGTVAKTFKINPKGTKIKKPKRAKKAIKVRWKKQTKKMSKSRVTGYQVQVATNKSFTKNKKTVTVKGYKKTSTRVKKLKAKKAYYVHVRTYKKIRTTKYYSPWSKTKRVKTK